MLLNLYRAPLLATVLAGSSLLPGFGLNQSNSDFSNAAELRAEGQASECGAPGKKSSRNKKGKGRCERGTRRRIAKRAQGLLDSLTSAGIPGASAALILPDDSMLAVTSGVSSMAEGTPMRPADKMLSGSIGKTYVSAIALDLIGKGKLSLDQRAAEILEPSPWLQRVPNGSTVTLQQLLQHTSGIPRYVFKPEFAKVLVDSPDRVWTPIELLEFVFDDEPLFEAGAGWAYSDTNYILVGMLIEKVSGEEFYDLVRERLLEPLQLTDTIPSNSRDLPGVIQGHVVMGRDLINADSTQVEGRFRFNPQFEWCGGGWANTPMDLARWARHLYGGSALESDYLESLLQCVEAPDLGPTARYSLGAILRKSTAGTWIGHDGFMPGYVSSMAFFPDIGLAAAIQLNSDDSGPLGRPLNVVLSELAVIAREELAKQD